jgi:hypothetical protein
MKDIKFYETLKNKIEDVLQSKNRDDKYVIFTEQCFKENEANILKLGLVESGIKIYTIPSNISVSKLVEEFDKKK